MARKAVAVPPQMIRLAEGCMVARRGRQALVSMIQSGVIRGEYDADAPLSQGRWKVAREDCERLRKDAETVTAERQRAGA